MRFLSPRSIRGTLLALSLATLGACGDSPTGPGGNGGPPRLSITNNTNASVFYLRIRSCGSSNWSNDLLGADIISKLETQTFTVPAGCHDVSMESNPDVNGEFISVGLVFEAGATRSINLTEWTIVE